MVIMKVLLAGTTWNLLQLSVSAIPAPPGLPVLKTTLSDLPIVQSNPEINTNWLKYKCDSNNLITDATTDTNARWQSVDTVDAWIAANDAVAGYRASNPQLTDTQYSEAWSQLIGNFFHAKSNMDCQDIGNNNCESTDQCNDVSTPAGSYVLNSMAQISRANNNYYLALINAETSITPHIDLLAKAFAPQVDNSLLIKEFLDAFSLIFGLAGAYAFNSFFKNVAFFKEPDPTIPGDQGGNPHLLGGIQDTINPVVVAAITLTKDVKLSGTVADPAGSLQNSMGNIFDAWKALLAKNNKQLFDGSDASQALLYVMMDGGKTIGLGFDAGDVPDLSQAITKVVYANVIPLAWQLSNEKLRPVILHANQPCTELGKVFPHGIDPVWGEKVASCVSNIIYYLVNARLVNGPNCPGKPSAGITICPATEYGTLPAYDQINGVQFGGLSLDDLTAGSVIGADLNANNQVPTSPRPPNTELLNSIYSNGVRAPGVVRIPVCNVGVVPTGPENTYGRNDNTYPCKVA